MDRTQKARIGFLKWHTLYVPYAKGIYQAKKLIRQLLKEFFLTFLFHREVIVNRPSGKVHYFGKLNKKEYSETRRKLIGMLFGEFNYIGWAKKEQIKVLKKLEG